MKTKIIFVALFLAVIANYSFGQTASDFEKKYGSKTYYEIRPKILMSAKFDKNGQVCQVAFQPNHISEKTNTNYIGQDILDLFELEEAFKEIVPADQRKDEIKSNGFSTSGGMFFGSFDYENIGVGLKGSWRSREKSNRVDFCKMFEDKSQAENKISPFCSPFGMPEIVTIVWTKRTCVEN